MGSQMKKLGILFLIVAAILLIGSFDYFTGSEIRVLALYFLPLLAAGWYLGRIGAVFISLFSTLVWLASVYASGVRFINPYIWVINGFTEGTGFLIISFLMAVLHGVLNRERSMSRTDSLTGMANRRSFSDVVSVGLAYCQRYKRPISLAYIDLDNFKNVNDTLGHHQGDSLLRQSAHLISACVRTTDTVARLGGDEFAVFLPETDFESAAILAERIRHSIETAPDFQSLGVTASIGVVSEIPLTSDVNALLGKADGLMYEVKREGKNSIRHQI